MLALAICLLASDPELAVPPVKVIASVTWTDQRWPAPVGGRGLAIRDAASLAAMAGLPTKGDGPARAEKALAAALGVKRIDWKCQTAVAIIAGHRGGRGGHIVEVNGVKMEKGVLKVSWMLHEPEGLRDRAIEHPTAVILLPRFTGKVVFDPPLKE